MRNRRDAEAQRFGKRSFSALQRLADYYRRENFYGTIGTSFNIGSSESERPDRSGGRAREDDQADHPRHAKSVDAGQDAGGDLHRRRAPAGEKEEGERGQAGRLDAQSGIGRGQETGRSGARGARAVDELPADE